MDEGGANPESIPGGMTLGLEIMDEREIFPHIFVDCGTGITAAALYWSLAVKNYPGTVHIVKMSPELSVDHEILKVKNYLQDWGLANP